jgi:hypothetical protein
MKKKLISIINRLPYFRGLFQENIDLKNRLKENKRHSSYPNGHYYSPIIDVDNIREREENIWNEKKEIKDISLNTEAQIELLQKLIMFRDSINFPTIKEEGYRYFFNNDYFSYTDGIILHLFLLYFRPKKVIEIGSGFSSALMLDTNDFHLENSIDLTFIEPYPDRLRSLFLNDENKTCKLLECKVQDVGMEVYQQLENSDILFIDSSHVCKTDSDLNHIFFEIMPTLKPGVIIHFHDIFYPFEYPKEWVLAGKNWNEIYFLRAFLMNNSNYEIIFFNDYLHKTKKELFENIPACNLNTGGSLWLRKR